MSGTFLVPQGLGKLLDRLQSPGDLCIWRRRGSLALSSRLVAQGGSDSCQARWIEPVERARFQRLGHKQVSLVVKPC